MTNKPLVTIITPSYNQAEFLESAILSVLNQGYEPLEYFVVDGGSTDGSIDIIKKYEHQLSGWVSEPDNGQAEAINKGFARAKGEMIAWLNSDDVYLPGAIEQAVELFNNNQEMGLVFANAITIDQDSRMINYLEFGDWDLAELLCFRIICQPAVFMKRSVLEEAGYLNPEFHFMLDHNLWIRIAMKSGMKYSGTPAVSNHKTTTAVWAAARHHGSAKNVSKPEEFANETLELKNIIESRPEYESYTQKYRHKIDGGAYRLIARYLLDAGKPGPALRYYWSALISDPGYALKHWHRMLYAILCVLGLDHLISKELTRRTANQDIRNSLAYIDSWCGIKISDGSG